MPRPLNLWPCINWQIQTSLPTEHLNCVAYFMEFGISQPIFDGNWVGASIIVFEKHKIRLKTSSSSPHFIFSILFHPPNCSMQAWAAATSTICPWKNLSSPSALGFDGPRKLYRFRSCFFHISNNTYYFHRAPYFATGSWPMGRQNNETVGPNQTTRVGGFSCGFLLLLLLLLLLQDSARSSQIFKINTCVHCCGSSQSSSIQSTNTTCLTKKHIVEKFFLTSLLRHLKKHAEITRRPVLWVVKT